MRQTFSEGGGAGKGQPCPDKTMPIAVVGIGCRCAGDATNPENLFDMVKKAREAWRLIPKDRYNNEAFYHPDRSRNGTSNIEGGHFLKESSANFDAPFFGMTSSEVAVMDPQQRLLLETSYEAFENAGVPMNKLVGSDTSCFVGSFCRDFSEMQLRDTENLPTYQPTGAGPSLAFLSNRLSYFYDCRGPSVSVDTACSASLVALHLACQTIRSGESRMSIVGGSNVLLSHEIMIGMSAMGFLSPDGRCYSFDHRANGYARGEGAVCMVLKSLEDAIKDGDTIRAVIRNTGCNQDGKTNGITLPNRAAQEDLVRSVYAKAGLDPLNTTYVEAHGTGTPAGDPLESAALSSVFCLGRPVTEPLIIGSIKSNMGHLEGASGLAGLVKVILMLENKMYLPNRNFEKANPRIPMADWKLKVLTEAEPWNCNTIRRASINSFGYGGTNAHAVLDEAEGYLAARTLPGIFRSRVSRSLAPPSPALDDGEQVHIATTDNRPKHLFSLSAFDEKAGLAYAKRLAEHVERQDSADPAYLSDLAYTLNERRTRFPWKAVVSANSAAELVQRLADEKLKFTKSGKPPVLGFVFTGQGAQWHAMGRELLTTSRVFYNTILRCDLHLRNVGADWSVITELTRDTETSRVNLAAFSQPLCTAIQIGVVDLLGSWGIKAASVTGHSSGEIASAYTAGAISLNDAIAIAYYRGVVASKINDLTPNPGSMMAAGLSAEDVQPYLADLKSGKACVACINSPTSITISGDEKAITELHGTLESEGLFARKLAVEVAYHSHHMELVAAAYKAALTNLEPKATSEVVFYSSVTGRRLPTADLGADYWVSNMVGQVRFSESLRELCLDSRAKKERRRRTVPTVVDMIVEIGPHAALAGPIKQIIKADQALSKASPMYASALQRGSNACETVLDLVALLFGQGYEVDFAALGRTTGTGSQEVLVDLPPYAWNHTNILWDESRISRSYRNRKHPRTDLLGVPDVNSNVLEPRWRNVLRPGENPWIRDHRVQGNLVYPAAGFIVMAIEAASQQAKDNDTEVRGFSLRNVVIGNALLVPEEGPEIETMITLRPYNESARGSSAVWNEFCVFSVTETDTWTKHCHGLIATEKKLRSSEVDGTLSMAEDMATTTQTISTISSNADVQLDVNEFYRSLTAIGLEYGPTFANVTKILAGPGVASAELAIANTADSMPSRFEYPFVVHPSTLDSCLHPLFLAVAGDKGGLRAAIPTFVEELYVSQDIARKADHRFAVYAESEVADIRQHRTSLLVVNHDDATQIPMIEVKGLLCTELEQKSLAEVTQKSRPICFDMLWRPDVDLLCTEQVASLCDPSEAFSFILKYVDLLAHKNPHLRILEVDSSGSLTTKILKTLTSSNGTSPRFASYDVAFASKGVLEDKASAWTGLVKARPLDSSEVTDTGAIEDDSYDLIIQREASYDGGNSDEMIGRLRKLLYPTGKWLIFNHSELENNSNLAEISRKAGMDIQIAVAGKVALLRPCARDTPVDLPELNIILDEDSSRVDTKHLQGLFESIGVTTHLKTLSEAEVSGRASIVLLDTTSDPITNPTEGKFEALKRVLLGGVGSFWVVKGATIDSTSPSANMIIGLSRAVRAETAGIMTVTLDLDPKHDQSGTSTSHIIFDTFVASFNAQAALESSPEVEYVERDGLVQIPRITEDVKRNRHIASRTVAPVPDDQPFWQPGRALVMDIKVPGLLDTLHFVDDNRMIGPLPDDFVEIEVRASGMNFKDVMMAMGQVKTEALGLECSGYIKAIGNKVTNLSVGDRVVTYAQGTYCNYLRQHSCAIQVIPNDMSFETASTIPIVYCTAYHSIFNVARVQKHESVLIHAASGGLGQAFIMLCQMIGAEVFATVGTLEKKKFLMDTYGIPEDHIFSSRDGTFAKRIMKATQGKGADVIMNSVAGEALRLTWGCIAPFGRFVELGRRDFEIDTRLDMQRFAKNISFAAVDFVHLAKDRPLETGQMWQKVMDLMRIKLVKPAQPIAIYPMSDAESALRIMQKGRHIGKLVLTANKNPLVKALPRPISSTLLRADSTYLLVGGLGGIGRATAMWLIEHGARHLIFANRSGMVKQEAKDVVQQLQAQGARVKVYSCDVGIEEQVEAMIQDSKANMPPIRGVIQGAMVLRDGLFDHMSLADYMAGVRPKVQGSWNLHNKLSQTDLDFFIMLSSISGVIGNASQAQYAAASTFLDAFADYRNSLNLPAVTLDLGVIHDIGFVADNEKLQKGFEQQNFEMIESTELLAMLEEAIMNPLRRDQSGQTVTGLGTYNPDASQPVHALPYFSHFRRMNLDTTSEDVNNKSAKPREILKAARSISDAAEAISGCIIAKISALVLLPTEDLSNDRPLSEYGIDSLVAVEMRNWLFREMEVAVSILELLANMTIMQLAEKLIKRSKIISAELSKSLNE